MPRERFISTAQWAERYRILAGGGRPGPFRLSGQPALRGILDAADDPAVRELWAIKSAQFGFTQGVEINVIFRRVHVDPCPILVLFPKDTSGKRFMREKLVPAIEATAEIAALIETEKRGPDNAQDYKKFPGGFLQLLGCNSPANLKSTDAPLVIVEEPDDTSKDVRGQGDAIVIGRERLKDYGDQGKLIVGGTGTVKGFSKVEAGLEKTDKRRFHVECPHCGHVQTLRWSRVRWQRDALTSHPVYGTHLPGTAVYACEACVTEDDDFSSEGCWSDHVKNRLATEASLQPARGWLPTAPFNGSAGFYINELISVATGSRFELLVMKFLEAEHALKQGDDSMMRSFVNNQLGETWEIKGNAPEIAALIIRGDDYAPWIAPAGGLVCTGTVDVQRGGQKIEAGLYWSVKAWGRGEESWLVARGVVPGNPLELATWEALDEIWTKPIRNAGGGLLGVSAVGIDSGDGMTAESVYRYVRPRKHRNFMATKGSSDHKREIFSAPSQSIDTTATDKAARWGLRPYQIGVERAKDLIAGRLQLEGDGPGRMHWYRDTPSAYFESLTSEVKMPGPRGRPVWTAKAGTRQEDLDLEVLHLHAARKLRIHTFTDADWRAVEERVRQRNLLDHSAGADQPVTLTNVPRGPTAQATAQPFTGFGTGRRDR